MSFTAREQQHETNKKESQGKKKKKKKVSVISYGHCVSVNLAFNVGEDQDFLEFITSLDEIFILSHTKNNSKKKNC